MHIFFSGIGGTGISSLALIAHEAGYDVSGSDARPSQYLDYLAKHGVTDTHVGVDDDFIAQVHARDPIDWFVYGSAQPMDFPDHPELRFCQTHGIKMSKRDEFLNQILTDKKLKLIAIAGTHGKTTTTAMAVWLFKQLGVPISYSGGAKLSFGDVGEFDAKSRYFIYEADEFDRNFLAFHPEMAIISGIDWDHPDIYPSRDSYYEAFRQFLNQSHAAVIWRSDLAKLGYESEKLTVADEAEPDIDLKLSLPGLVNRQDAWLVALAVHKITGRPMDELLDYLNDFPGVSRRFEQIAPNLYTDYAHTPAKIRGALQLANETAGDDVVVIYEGLHNTRQHFIKDELADLFNEVKELYVVPSYLARENKDLELLTPEKILDLLSNSAQAHGHAAQLDDELKRHIQTHLDHSDLVLAFSAGGGGSLDEWLRQEFKKAV